MLASAAAYAPRSGRAPCVATSDRDSFALIDDNTKMLRILNGGVDASPLLDPHRLLMVTGVRPEQYLDFAALRGDASDNLPGVHGIGPKTAARLLAEFGRRGRVRRRGRRRRALPEGPGRRGRPCGSRRPRPARPGQLNWAVMAMVAYAPLGLDLDRRGGLSAAREDDVRQDVHPARLHVPERDPRADRQGAVQPRPLDVDASWRPSARRTTMRHPALTVPRQPRPTSVQETLF